MMKPQRGKTPRGKTPRKPSRQTDPVQVYCRIKPLNNPDEDTCVKVLDSKVIQLRPPENSLRNGGVMKESQFTFQHVFDEFTSQKALFDNVGLPLASDVLWGKNALLFAYGVTSSGKTFTMAGSPQKQGILPRCLDVIFNSIKDQQAKKYVFKPDKMNGFDVQSEADAMMERQRRDIMPKLTQTSGPSRDRDMDPSNRERDPSRIEEIEEDNNYAVFVSYVEIYNNYIYDLMEELPYDPITGYKAPQSKILREDSDHNMYVSGVTEVEVKSTEEAYEVLWQGQKRRKVANTALNQESSRSHSVFNIRVVQAPLDPRGEEVLQDKDKICVSQLSLVDLAGSERCGRTQAAGDRLREAGNINQSLMVLRTCIEILRENQKNGGNRMVPFRDSRLTHLFKNYFDGEGKVRMVVCVNPKWNEYEETMHVMRFAELTQEVQVARPQQVRFDIGLQKGRGRINQQYREAVARVAETGGDPNGIPVPEPLVYSMGPPFPILKLQDPSDDSVIGPLIEFLKSRMLRRNTLNADLLQKIERFRGNLVDTEKENISLKRHIEEVEIQMQSQESQRTKMERKMRSIEKTNEILTRTTNQYEQEMRSLEREVGQAEWKVQMEKTEKDRMKMDYHAKLVLTEQNFNRNLERERKKLQEANYWQLQAKQRKLEMVKSILNTQESDLESLSNGSSGGSTRPRTTVASRNQQRILSARSEPNLSDPDLTKPKTPAPAPKPSHFRARTATASSRINALATPRGRARSPPPVKPKPAVNLRHRRSKSSHEIYLDHKPAGHVDTGTLMQPQMKKRKSVTKLTEKDVTKKASKYVLNHQELDSDGGLATKLVKGDVLPTAGGGAAVVFTDVEILKQKEPGDRKRRSPDLRPQDFEGEWTDTESRCRVAIEGHGMMKRTKTSV